MKSKWHVNESVETSIMLYKFLQAAFERHLIGTLPIINQLKDSVVMSSLFEEGRPLGDIILHTLRIDFYSRGSGEGIWEPLIYSLKEYEKADVIKGLTNEVFIRTKQYIAAIDPDSLMREITPFNQPATVA